MHNKHQYHHNRMVEILFWYIISKVSGVGLRVRDLGWAFTQTPDSRLSTRSPAEPRQRRQTTAQNDQDFRTLKSEVLKPLT